MDFYLLLLNPTKTYNVMKNIIKILDSSAIALFIAMIAMYSIK